MGMGQVSEDIDELKTRLKRQHAAIERQAATITRMQAQFADIDKMPDETRAQLLRQLARQRGRRRGRGR